MTQPNQGVALNFDARTVDPAAPRDDFNPVPDGWYPVKIEETGMKPNAKNTGAYLELVMPIIDGEFKGQKLWDRLNINNPNPTAVNIAYETLSAICHATGQIQVQNSMQLHNIPLEAKVKLVPAVYEDDGKTVKYKAKNEVKGYRPMGGGQTQGGGQAPPSMGGGQAPPSMGGYQPPAQGGAPQGGGYQQPPAQSPAQGGGYQQPPQNPAPQTQPGGNAWPGPDNGNQPPANNGYQQPEQQANNGAFQGAQNDGQQNWQQPPAGGGYQQPPAQEQQPPAQNPWQNQQPQQNGGGYQAPAQNGAPAGGEVPAWAQNK